MAITTWPENCPTCGAEWKVRSRTMGARMGQPHRGRCANGHWWHEPADAPTREVSTKPTEVATDGPCWLFEVQKHYGGHVTVTVRCGSQPHDRALVGHLTMRDKEWFALRETLRMGAPEVKQSWWKGRFDFKDGVPIPTANDIGV